MLSLANCLETVCSQMTLPKLLDFERENQKLKKLSEDNDKLKEQITDLSKELNQEKPCSSNSVGIQTNEIAEMEAEITKMQKRSSSIKGRFGWKMLGSKEKESKSTSKESPSSKQENSLNKQETLLNKQETPLKQAGRTGLEETLPSVPSGAQAIAVTENIASDDSIAGNIEIKEKIQFQSNYYASVDNSNSGNKEGIVKNSNGESRCSDSSIGDNVGKSCGNDESDAPFIILNQNEFTEHTHPIVSCRFSENNNLVASLDLDGALKVWQCYPTVAQASVFSSKGDILSLDWIPKTNDKILIGKSNGLISVQDISSKKALWESPVHQKYKRIARVNCSPTSTSAVCSAVLPMCDTKKATSPSSKFANQQKMIKMKQYSACNDSGGTKHGIISEWDLQVGQLKSELCLDPYPVCIHSMAYNHNGTLLVTGGADGMVRLFDIRNSDCLIGWHAHSTDILDVVFNPDETSIYSIAADGKVCVWDINKVSSKIAEFPLQVGCTGMHHYWTSGDIGMPIDEIPSSKLLACDSEGQHMMTCGPSGLMIYKIKPKTTMDEAMHILCPSSEVLTLDWTSSPNCSTVMCGTKKGTVQISTLLRK